MGSRVSGSNFGAGANRGFGSNFGAGVMLRVPSYSAPNFGAWQAQTLQTKGERALRCRRSRTKTKNNTAIQGQSDKGKIAYQIRGRSALELWIYALPVQQG